MRHTLRLALRLTIITVVRWLLSLIFKLEIRGWENVPRRGPLLVVANHFSFFEPVLTGVLLPFDNHFMAAEEVLEHPVAHFFGWLYDVIPIRRGTVDRAALRAAAAALEGGGVLVIMPEGGIRLDLMAISRRGEHVHAPLWDSSRLPARLTEARPGVAYLATRVPAPILPIAFLGTEHTLHNMRAWRRTPVTMIIGAPLPPLNFDPDARGEARREALAAASDALMRAIAALMPPAYRGPFQEV